MLFPERFKIQLFFFSIALTLIGSSSAKNVPGTGTVNTSAQDKSNQTPSSIIDAITRNNFNLARLCYGKNIQANIIMNSLAICDRGKGKTPSACAAQAALRGRKLDSYNKALDGAGCSKDPDISWSNLARTTDRASLRGNTDAQMCYVAGYVKVNTPIALATYKQRAVSYANAALQRGDWRIVELFSTPQRVIASGGAGAFANFKGAGNPLTVYSANQLLMLGAKGTYHEYVTSRSDDAARFLTPEQQKQGKSWAQKEFDAQFYKSPPLGARVTPCVDTDPADQ